MAREIAYVTAKQLAFLRDVYDAPGEVFAEHSPQVMSACYACGFATMKQIGSGEPLRERSWWLTPKGEKLVRERGTKTP